MSRRSFLLLIGSWHGNLVKVFMIDAVSTVHVSRFMSRGCRLAWSRLVASGVIDESSNLSSPTISIFSRLSG